MGLFLRRRRLEEKTEMLQRSDCSFLQVCLCMIDQYQCVRIVILTVNVLIAAAVMVCRVGCECISCSLLTEDHQASHLHKLIREDLRNLLHSLSSLEPLSSIRFHVYADVRLNSHDVVTERCMQMMP